MKINYYKINPTGNITLIVETPVSRESQAAVAARLMEKDPDAEQVGFLEIPENPDCKLRLQMMGGEFCGNATIAAAALHMSMKCPSPSDKSDFYIEVSGACKPLNICVECLGENSFSGSLSMPLPEAYSDCELLYDGKRYILPVIRMPGICHAVVTAGLSPEFAKKVIAEWCTQLNTEALGIMFYDSESGVLKPLVYVKSTGSTVWESSCASGSCAVSVYESVKHGEGGLLHLMQPGGALTVRTVFAQSELEDVILTGNARICGKYSAVIDT